MDMTIATLEVYMAIPPDEKKPLELEAYGLLWGHQVTLPDGDVLYAVEKLTIDSLARRKNDEVTPSNGIGMIKDLVTSYWPKYELLGNFHTHPEKHYAQVEKEWVTEFSEEDREFMIDLGERDEDFRVGLVMTIAYLDRTVNREPDDRGNCVTWDFNNYRFWLNACIIGRDVEEDDDGDVFYGEVYLYPNSPHWEEEYEPENVDSVILHCPYLVSPWAATEFGKKKGDKHLIGVV